MTSLPRSERTSSTHLLVFMNDARSASGQALAVSICASRSRPPRVNPRREGDALVMSYTTTATLESRM